MGHSQKAWILLRSFAIPPSSVMHMARPCLHKLEPIDITPPYLLPAAAAVDAARLCGRLLIVVVASSGGIQRALAAGSQYDASSHVQEVLNHALCSKHAAAVTE